MNCLDIGYPGWIFHLSRIKEEVCAEGINELLKTIYILNWEVPTTLPLNKKYLNKHLLTRMIKLDIFSFESKNQRNLYLKWTGVITTDHWNLISLSLKVTPCCWSFININQGDTNV